MNRNTRYLVAGAGIGALLWYALKPSSMNMKEMVNSAVNKLPFGKNNMEPAVAKAGLSDPMDLDDNKMVSEGSQYGVHYYNKNEQDNA
ncbi:hypothetical protein [Neobacillus sp. YIM B06451]|uniref:hypothetical protein n=1 Tax=Neobacillus sp. YIM B06451 TaxID=3070994 RepID=UPI00292EEC68|nr:hypothetical protein [Neobacillus sp. YIM B06451]